MTTRELSNDELLDGLQPDEIFGHGEEYRAELVRRLNERDSLEKIAAEGRHAGREEALAIIMAEDAEDPFISAVESYSMGDTGDYGTRWNERELRAKLNISTPGEMASRLDHVDGCYWEMAMENEELADAAKNFADAYERLDDDELAEECICVRQALARRETRLGVNARKSEAQS